LKSPVSLNAGATTVESPIQGPSVSDTHGFKIADDVLKDVKALNEVRLRDLRVNVRVEKLN
jgi:hypothetical protein